MPFLSHLAELRQRLAILVGVLLVVALGLYFFTDPIWKVLTGPVVFLLPGGKGTTLSPLEAMTLKFKIAIWSSVLVCSPLVIWQTFAFFLPALKPKERRWFVPTFVAAVILFMGGVTFCYQVVLHTSVSWLAAQNGQIFTLLPRAQDVLTVVTFFLVGFGIAFETPIVVFYLVYFGVIQYEKLRKNWRVVYVAIAIIAAMITPDWSPISMGALAIAMVVLYELSMATVRVVLARKIAAQKLAEAAEEAA